MFKYLQWGLPDLVMVFASFAVESAAFLLLLLIAKKLKFTPKQMILWLWEKIWGRE